jgi:hypothetical protein
MARYFAELQPDPQLVDAYVAMVRTIKLYTTKGRLREAALVRKAYQDMVRDYELLAKQGAMKADTFVRDRLRQTAVRPPATGSLAAAVHSEPLKLPFPGGGVGIANIGMLDKGAFDQGSYWRAQEYGTTAHVGRRVVGFFEPGRAKPSAAQFRNHPFFEQAKRGKSGKAQKGTPAMVIRRPIHARHFLRDGAVAFAVWHEQQSTRINNRAISRLP